MLCSSLHPIPLPPCCLPTALLRCLYQSSAVIVGLLLLVVRWVLYYLPSAVLSSTVIMAVSSLVDIATARRLWRQDKSDFWVRRSLAARVRAALCPRLLNTKCHSVSASVLTTTTPTVACGRR